MFINSIIIFLNLRKVLTRLTNQPLLLFLFPIIQSHKTGNILRTEGEPEIFVESRNDVVREIE
jgi:hypothetical protein